MVPPMTLAPTSLVTGINSPVTMDSSTALRPSTTDAVDRHLFAGADPQAVADLHRVELDFLLGAVGVDPPRGLRREVEQRADRAARALPRPQFQNLPKQHEDGDDRGGLEIDRHRAVGAAEGGREQPGARVATTL